MITQQHTEVDAKIRANENMHGAFPVEETVCAKKIKKEVISEDRMSALFL